MKKIIPGLFVLTIISGVLHAQKGTNQISIGPEVDIPVGSFANAYKAGFGGTLKGLYGVGTAGQITLMSGYSSFTGKSGSSGGYSYSGYTYSIIPILAGYRQNFNGLYVEPELGVASYTTRVSGMKVDGETRFTYAIGIGYAMKSIDLGARFQNHTGSGLVAIRAAYSISFKK